MPRGRHMTPFPIERGEPPASTLSGQAFIRTADMCQRLMRVLGLAGMAPGPAPSHPHPQHKIYPYLLRGVSVTRPNQVWITDITYICLAHGFAYLVAWDRTLDAAIRSGKTLM